jgi:hypothetical protein
VPSETLLNRITDQIQSILQNSKEELLATLPKVPRFFARAEWNTAISWVPGLARKIVAAVRKEYGKMTFDEFLDDINKTDTMGARDGFPCNLAKELIGMRAELDGLKRMQARHIAQETTNG